MVEELHGEVVLPDIVYVNAYRVTRMYGGPEEGGWWFDAGQVLGSIPVQRGYTAQYALAELTLRERVGFEPAHNRYSVLGDEGDFVIQVQEHPGQNWPEEYPHYE